MKDFQITLTNEIVYNYQELYYNYYKPITKLLDPKDPNFRTLLRNEMKPYLEKVGWSFKYFETLVSIDLFQRLVYDTQFMKDGRKLNYKSNEEYRHLDPNYGALRLKCLKRTEQPDETFYN